MNGYFPNSSIIEYGHTSSPKEGETESGDAYFLKIFSNKVLLAVIDGLGHGSEAATASKIVVSTLNKYSSSSLNDLIRQCHQSLIKTNGVVMTIALINAEVNTVTYIGIGNIEGVLLQMTAPPIDSTEKKIVHNFLISQNGIIGFHLPNLRERQIPIFPNDLLIMFTDGIRSNFQLNFPPNDSPQRIADYLFNNYRKGTDDALVLVIRYLNYKR